MGFFQDTVVHKYLRTNDANLISQAYAKFGEHFHNPRIQENIRNSKEEQYQGEFLIDLFVKVLGYTKNPNDNFNLTTEYKNIKDSKKADGAILVNGTVKAVIELKGTNTTDLGKVEEQAFGYKNNQPECIYVITSNFEKLRLYIDNAIEHIEFNLFTLNFKEFELLYLCLAFENIERNIPKKIKDESLSEEDVITKKLYKDYSIFKSELFNNIVTLNPGINPIDLFQKTQKLIDRFLFLFFAEDRSLLPPNSVRLILSDWKDLQDRDEDIGLYDRFKKYFEYLNTGYKGKRYEVFAYNGGLFKLDEILDVIKIDSDLLYKHTLKLSEYNFNSEVDVNILGHIFENSLNELDELKAQSEGEAIDRKKTRRKKDGVFYTPKYITKYIVDNTVGKLCLEKKQEIDIRDEDYVFDKKRPKKSTLSLVEKLNQYKAWLLEITICDPACGSGAFLNQALDFLIKEHKYIDELHAKLLGETLVFSDIEKSILEKNLYGVDINEESVEIAKLSLWLRTAQPNRKLNDLNNNIKCGNSLIDDSAVAGDKAFNWKNEFPDIFSKGGFDVVIGNPPYVRQELLGDYKEYFSKNYEVFNFSSDLFAYFYEKAFTVLKPKGIFSFISNTFDKTKAGVELRNYLKNNIKFIQMVNFTHIQIFQNATTYPIILVARKEVFKLKSNEFEYTEIPSKSNPLTLEIEYYDKNKILQNSLENKGWIFKSDESNIVFYKIQKYKSLKEKYGKCYYGVKTSLNEAFITNKLLKTEEHVLPIYEGKEIEKWASLLATQKLILFKSSWTKSQYGKDINEINAIFNLKRDYPEIMELLMPFIDPAKKRYDQGDFWWELRKCAYYDLFDKPKIIFPNLQNRNKFCYDETGTFVNAPAVFIPTDCKALLAILNSSLIWYFLSSICVVRNGGYIEVKPQYFEQIPIPDIDFNYKHLLIAKTDSIICATKARQDIVQKFKKSLGRKFELPEFSKKLNEWYMLSFEDFMKELSKYKIKLTLSEEAEWEEYFNMERKKVLDLLAEIESTDKEIDQMVYKLYELTEEEIRIVESSN